jgi:hypothetical protein
MIVVGILMLTLHDRVNNRIFLIIFVTVMVGSQFIPYVVRLLVMPTFPGFGNPMAILAWLSPYMIVVSLYYMLVALLFVLEIRSGDSYQESRW